MRIYLDNCCFNRPFDDQSFITMNRQLGIVETERFIALIQREKFDYTVWRQNLFAGLSGEEISKRAMAFLPDSDNQQVRDR
jgi:hypothetical protein